jgi:hypothetical protein
MPGRVRVSIAMLLPLIDAKLIEETRDREITAQIILK